MGDQIHLAKLLLMENEEVPGSLCQHHEKERAGSNFFKRKMVTSLHKTNRPMPQPSISSKQRFGSVQPFPKGTTAGHTGMQQSLNLISAEVSCQ